MAIRLLCQSLSGLRLIGVQTHSIRLIHQNWANRALKQQMEKVIEPSTVYGTSKGLQSAYFNKSTAKRVG